MVLFPNCKINIGLNIIGKRADGYHDLETVFYPVALTDALEIIRSPEISFQLSGLPVNDANENNLCLKAYNLLKKDYPDLPPVSIHLHKAIPIGAGLGGGSADGAFMLTLLDRKFQLNLSQDKLIYYALQLGSDCPFFIVNKPCLATGRGEKLSPVELDLGEYDMVLINPKVHISTREAFSQLVPTIPEKAIAEIIRQPIVTWKDELKNDFEKTVFEFYPAIKKIKDDLYQAGAVYASMTGTGSTVFGIFNKNEKTQLFFPPEYMVKRV
jgi:4-diphosphocytidyl-2-C-methyl-D-erythritol kinase